MIRYDMLTDNLIRVVSAIACLERYPETVLDLDRKAARMYRRDRVFREKVNLYVKTIITIIRNREEKDKR
jgi:hypothetical protein